MGLGLILAQTPPITPSPHTDWALIVVAAIAAIPATFAAVAAFRGAHRAEAHAAEVRDVLVPQEHDQVQVQAPNLGDMIVEIYEKVGLVEGRQRAHEVDPEAHTKPKPKPTKRRRRP